MSKVKGKLQPDRYGFTDDPDHEGDRSAYNYGALRNDDTDVGDIDLVPVDYPNRNDITQTRNWEGWIVCRFNPHGNFKIVARRDGREVEPELRGGFTHFSEAARAILKYRGEMQ